MRAPLPTSLAPLLISLVAASSCAPAPAPVAVPRSTAAAPLFARSRALPPPCAAPALPADEAVCGAPEAPCVVLARTPLPDWQVSGLELVRGQPVLSTRAGSGLLIVEQGRFVHHPAPTDGQLFVRGGAPWWVRVEPGSASSHAYRFDGKGFELPVEWPGNLWSVTVDAGGCLHGFQAEADGTHSYVRLGPDDRRALVRDAFPGVRVRAAQYLVDGAGGALLAQRRPGGVEVGYMRPEGAPLLVEADAHTLVFGGAEPHLLVQRPGGVLAHVRLAAGRQVERVLFRPEEEALPGGLASKRVGRWVQGLSTATSIRAIYAASTWRGRMVCGETDVHPDDGDTRGRKPGSGEARGAAGCVMRDGEVVGSDLFIVGAAGEPVPLPLGMPARDERGGARHPIESPRLDGEGRIHAISGSDYVVLGTAGQPAMEVGPPPSPAPRRLSKTYRIPFASARALFDAGWAHSRPAGAIEGFVDGAYRARSSVLETWRAQEYAEVGATPWFVELDLTSVAGRAGQGCFGVSLHVADDRFDADLGIDEAGVTLKARLGAQGGAPEALHHATSLAAGARLRVERRDQRVVLAVDGVAVATGEAASFPRPGGAPPLLLVALETRPCGAAEASVSELRYGPLSGAAAGKR